MFNVSLVWIFAIFKFLLVVLDLVLDFLNSYVWIFCFLFLCVLKFFTAYNFCLLFNVFSLLFHLVFCLLDFGFLLLMVLLLAFYLV
ncbi:hypothetical protein HMPREF1403_01676 [Helicobacter pylori GAM201Ai]|nr:hypothetical protein HMPREF1403_01676 [Helicobacter pylori GAM201Ai]